MSTKKKCSNEYEKEYWPKQQLILGIDEAGRGPLAGPLCVAGVIFPIGYENDEIYDSKGLSEKKREELFDIIEEDAEYFEIVCVSEKEIDELNIYQATKKAMQEIAEKAPDCVVITDAMPLDIKDKIVFHPVKGDQKSIHVAAASILAKVTRDRIMMELDKKYPEYGLKKNKGYPTKEHLEAIEKYGIRDIHRKSYKPIKAKQEKLDLF